MAEQFRKITLSGSPEEIGLQHGKLLSDQIHRNIEFYKPLFLANLGGEAQVLQSTGRIKEHIKAFNPKYITEIDHIALGAEVSEPLWLYAINARTELALTKHYAECTAMVFPQHNIIGQTWDWAQPLEDNSVIMEILFPSGHRILQLTEAGIIGKIGLNNRGLGVTLNILWILDRVLLGVPIHIMLRAVLESQTLEGARNIINRSGNRKVSNIIVSQAGQAFDIEFCGNDSSYHDIQEVAYTHTNHFIHSGESVQIDETACAASIARYNTVIKELRKVQDFSIQDMLSILSGQANGENSILAAYKPDTHLRMGYCGTLATIVMDLEKRTLKVRKGNPSSPSFSIDSFTQFLLSVP